MDRASGSGVFARDPDALLDLTELELSESLRKSQNGKARIKGIEKALSEFCGGWEAQVGQDDRLSPSQMQDFAAGKLTFDQVTVMERYIASELEIQNHVTGWRIEGTLREFPSFDPINLWFEYPVHKSDDSGVLADIKVDDGNPWTKRKKEFYESQKEKGEETYQMYLKTLEELFQDCDEVSADDLAEAIGKSKETVRKDFCGGKNKGKFNPRYKKRFKDDGYFYDKGGIIRKTDNCADKRE